MLASCSICGDVFTGIHPESVHSTPCGHVFHLPCLMQWLQRSPTCPHCRTKVTDKQVIKLYFHNNSNLSIKEDISTLTHQVQSLSYDNTLKKEEIKSLKTESKKDKESLATLKKHIKDVEDRVRGHQTVVSSLQENIRFLKSECKKSMGYQLEAEDLKKDLEKYESIKKILYGTLADSQEAVCLLKKKTDIQTLCLLITSFKREIKTLRESNKELEGKFSLRVSKYMELKKYLLDLKSKESMNERVVEKLKLANSDLESEIVKLRKKCGQLESMVQGNDSTPRRKELCKRLIHESPAPELPTTPIVEEDLKIANSASSSAQPNGKLKPQILDIKAEQSPSQFINPFVPKSPRRLIGFMRPTLTTKSVSANHVSRSRTESSSSDEEMFDGLGGRSKPDVYPSKQKPLVKKRKLVSNLKKKLPPPMGNTTLDSFLTAEIL